MNATDQNVTHENEAHEDEEVPSTPIWLKALVTVLGVAIVAMLLLIVFKIANGDHQKTGQAQQDAALPSVAANATLFPPIPVSAGDYEVPRPEGATLVSVMPAGAEVYMHFRSEEGTEQIIILNRQTGALSTITIP